MSGIKDVRMKDGSLGSLHFSAKGKLDISTLKREMDVIRKWTKRQRWFAAQMAVVHGGNRKEKKHIVRFRSSVTV